MSASRSATALAAAAPLGPFFATASSPGADWTTWASLCAEPEVLRHRLDLVRAALGSASVQAEVPLRVAASIAHLGLVARLVSPPLGAALVTGSLPLAGADDIRLRLAGTNPLPLSIAAPDLVRVTDAHDLADAIARHWIAPLVAPLTAAVQVLSGSSAQVLTGNVISAVAGALRMAATARPALSATADATLDDLLRSGPLAGTGHRRDDGSFVRRSCCLFYRLPGAGTCGDCVLADPA